MNKASANIIIAPKSALDLYDRARKVMLDAGGITLAPFSVAIHATRAAQEAFNLQTRIDFNARYSQLFAQRQLMQGLHPTPIIQAELKNSAVINVHFLINEPLQESLFLSIPNLLEVDLSDTPGHLSDKELRAWILCDADRYWFGCNLYDDLPQVQRLREKAKAASGQAQPPPAEDPQTCDDNELREEEREQIEHLLEPLHRMISGATGPEYRASLVELHEDKWSEVQASCEFTADQWPEYLDAEIDGEWVFGCDRKIWQGHVYGRFIKGKVRGQKIIPVHVLNSTIKHCGAVSWAHDLVKMKFAHQKHSYNESLPFAERKIWYLTQAENDSIKVPHTVCKSFLDQLVRKGILVRPVTGSGYEVV